MLKFTFNIVKSLIVFSFRASLILGGLVFSSVGNAVWAFFSSESQSDQENSESDKIKATDEVTAMNAGLSEMEMGNYWGLGEQDK